MTTRCGILLHPAGHTLSPVLHEAAYDVLRLDASYEVWDVEPGDLAAHVQRLRDRGSGQLSISLPHKESVIALADSVADAVREIGAANTLTMRDGSLLADNTDWIGVRRSLEPRGPWDGARGLVVGAGGTARAAVYALRQLGLEVGIVNRTPERAAKVAAQLGARVANLDADWDLLVHVTPVGMDPAPDGCLVPAEKLRPGATVLDSVYRPLETRLLREAREHGCQVVDGLEMLVHQAIEQIRLWSDSSVDDATALAQILREAALRELRG